MELTNEESEEEYTDVEDMKNNRKESEVLKKIKMKDFLLRDLENQVILDKLVDEEIKQDLKEKEENRSSGKKLSTQNNDEMSFAKELLGPRKHLLYKFYDQDNKLHLGSK